jgi:hypothetical protein
MIKLQVSEFGPIVEGAVHLKPLTIFVGPNNSGKSYFAVLAYALFLSFPSMYAFSRGVLPWRLRRFRFHPQRYLPGMGEISPVELLDDKQVLKSLQNGLKSLIGGSRNREISISFKDLPDKVKQGLEQVLQNSMSECAIALGEELKRCYASVIPELTRKTSKGAFTVSVSQENPPLQLNMSYTDDNLRLVDSHFDVSNLSVGLKIPSQALQRRMLRDRGQFLLYELAENFVVKAYRDFLVDPYYFPAARSGILQSHKALAGYIVLPEIFHFGAK